MAVGEGTPQMCEVGMYVDLTASAQPDEVHSK
jgi:hypothetical protein